jgi:uncharacterized membrane protein YbhN (UPF0104 family)
VLFLTGGVFYWKILLVFLAVLAGASAFMLSWKFLGKNKFKFGMMNTVFEGLNYFRKQKKLLGVLLALNFVSIIMLALRFFVAFQAVKTAPGFAGMFLLANLVYFSFILSLTPANLGIMESIITVTAGAIGLSNVDGALASLVDRGINFILTFILGTFFGILLFGDLKFVKTNEDIVHNA